MLIETVNQNIYIIYTPNLGFEIVVPGQERELGRFRGSRREQEGARGSKREHRGSKEEHRGSTKG